MAKLKRLKRLASVPALSDYYNIYECSYNDLGIQTVDVSKIMGMTNPKNQQYNTDFSPINTSDPDWLNKKELVGNGGQLDPIVLILTDTGDYFYYGNGNGANTVSVAKVMNIPTIQAQVMELVVNQVAAKRIIRLKKTATVPTLSDFYVAYDYDYVDIGLQTVDVDKIVGISNGRNDEYNSDFMPKDENDSRWLYQKELVESGGKMEPIPLIKMPDGNYVGNGDGSHRISVAKVMNIPTIQAIVSVMIPTDEGIDEQWEKYSAEKKQEIDILSDEYKSMGKQIEQKRNEAFESGNELEYEKFLEEYYSLGSTISDLDEELRDEEKKFKQDLIEQYIN